ALIVIFIIVIVFWMVFHQNGSTLTYWADDNTDWNVSGIISNAINPFFVVTLTFPLVWFWGWLNSKGLEPSTPAKIGLGMLLTTGSFTILYCAAKTGEAEVPTPQMYATGDFRVTERSLHELSKELMPDDLLQRLQLKDREGKLIILDKKFATDEKSSGEQKLTNALDKVFAAEKGLRTQIKASIMRHSYLYRMS